MTFVVVKLMSSSSEVSLALCAIATVDQAVEICLKAAAGCIEVFAAKEDKNLPYAQLLAAAFSNREETSKLRNCYTSKDVIYHIWTID